MSERSKILYLVRLLGLIASLVLVGRPIEVAAQTTGDPCASGPGSFSVLFLVDQSDSMSGTTVADVAIPASDPTGLRQYAPGFALSWIVQHPRPTPTLPIDVLGVVSFGRTASVDLPLTAVASNQFGPAADAERQRLANAFRLELRGDTDFLPAFVAAEAQFEQQARTCGDEIGERAIILVTDGAPCVVAAGCNPKAPYWPGDRAYLKQVFEDVEAMFDPHAYRLWVLTLTRPDAVDLERTLPAWTELAERYRGTVISLRHDPVDLQRTVDGILDELSHVPITPTSSPTPSPSPSPGPSTSTPTPVATATAIVPPPTPSPTPSPPSDGGQILIVAGIMTALAVLGGLLFFLSATHLPRGSLVFVGTADREERGRLAFNGWSPVTYLNAADCARLLPSLGIASLTVRAGPIVGGRTTIDLTLIGADGHIVNHRFYDTEADFVNDRREDEVVYEAMRVFPRPRSLWEGAAARPGGVGQRFSGFPEPF